jgi:hypothetical protein
LPAKKWVSRKPPNRVGIFKKSKFSFLIQKAPFIMKKAKIMLMSIAVLATVGSALAFKVAKKGSTRYCYLETSIAPDPTVKGLCPNQINSAVANTGTKYFYTELKAANCNQQDKCQLEAASFGI